MFPHFKIENALPNIENETRKSEVGAGNSENETGNIEWEAGRSDVWHLVHRPLVFEPWRGGRESPTDSSVGRRATVPSIATSPGRDERMHGPPEHPAPPPPARQGWEWRMRALGLLRGSYSWRHGWITGRWRRRGSRREQPSRTGGIWISHDGGMTGLSRHFLGEGRVIQRRTAVLGRIGSACQVGG